MSERDDKVAGTGWTGHWHAGIHRAYGNTMYLVLLNFATDSAAARPSIVGNLIDSGIADYMIFNLYSQWDIAIRVWADDQAIAQLRKRLGENRDIDILGREINYFQISSIDHFPDGRKRYPSIDSVDDTLPNITVDAMRDVQNKGTLSQHFESLHSLGLIIDDATRFDPLRIQFYIFVKGEPLNMQRARQQLSNIVGRSRAIGNRSVMFPARTATIGIVKGQVRLAKFYEIHPFLQKLSIELKDVIGTRIETETMVVASQHEPTSARIDFERIGHGRLPQISLADIIKSGESGKVEFKSTQRMNLKTEHFDDSIVMSVLKTVAAFLNTDGGHLVIGIADGGKPVEPDADRFESDDKAMLHLTNLIRDRIGPLQARAVQLRFEEYQAHRLLLVECPPGHVPAYLKDKANSRETFFIRTGPATNELTGRHLSEYLRERFQARH